MYQNTEPARYWQDQLILWGPKVLLALLILIITHFVAKAVQWGVAKMIDRVPVLKRHPGVGGDSVGTELGRLAYWLVWLVGLIAALQPLGLSGVLTPVTALTNEVFAFLPRLLGAGLFFFAGLILARIVRHAGDQACRDRRRGHDEHRVHLQRAADDDQRDPDQRPVVDHPSPLPKPPPPGVSMTNRSPTLTSAQSVAVNSSTEPSVRSTQLRPGRASPPPLRPRGATLRRLARILARIGSKNVTLRTTPSPP